MLKNAKFAKILMLGMNSKLANISKLLSANVIAQAIGILIYPILTRLYEPADFTLVTLFLTIANTILIISTLDLQYAIPLPKKEEGAYALVGAMFISLCITASLTLLVCIFYKEIAFFFGVSDLKWALWYLPIYIPVLGSWQILSYVFNRDKQYGKIAKYQVAQSVSNSALKLIFGFLGFGGLSLIDASVIGPLIAIGLTSPMKIWDVIQNMRRLPTHMAKDYLHIYRDFPLFSMPKNLVCHLSNGLPVLMLTSVYGATNVGYFSLAITIGYLPLIMVAGSIYQVMLRNTSEKLNENKPIYPEIHKFCAYSTMIIVPMFAILYFILPFATEVLFGEGWGKTGEILRILLPWLAGGFLTSTLVFVPETLLKLKGNLIIEMTFIVLRILALAWGIHNYSFFVTIKLFCIVSCGIKFFQAGWFVWIAKQHDRELSKRNLNA